MGEIAAVNPAPSGVVTPNPQSRQPAAAQPAAPVEDRRGLLSYLPFMRSGVPANAPIDPNNPPAGVALSNGEQVQPEAAEQEPPATGFLGKLGRFFSNIGKSFKKDPVGFMKNLAIDLGTGVACTAIAGILMATPLGFFGGLAATMLLGGGIKAGLGSFLGNGQSTWENFKSGAIIGAFAPLAAVAGRALSSFAGIGSKGASQVAAAESGGIASTLYNWTLRPLGNGVRGLIRFIGTNPIVTKGYGFEFAQRFPMLAALNGRLGSAMASNLVAPAAYASVTRTAVSYGLYGAGSGATYSWLNGAYQNASAPSDTIMNRARYPFSYVGSFVGRLFSEDGAVDATGGGLIGMGTGATVAAGPSLVGGSARLAYQGVTRIGSRTPTAAATPTPVAASGTPVPVAP